VIPILDLGGVSITRVILHAIIAQKVVGNNVHVTPRPIPGPAVLTPDSSLGSYIVPTNQHESFVRTFSSLMRTRENFPVDHPS
jgi:hypothetical protein